MNFMGTIAKSCLHPNKAADGLQIDAHITGCFYIHMLAMQSLPYQAKGTSLKWPILCWVGRKTLTSSAIQCNWHGLFTNCNWDKTLRYLSIFTGPPDSLHSSHLLYLSSDCLFTEGSSAFPPVDIIWAMMIVWRIRRKIIRTVLCCVVYNTCTQWYAHTLSAVL